MSFWDSSAIIPALSTQAASPVIENLILEDEEMTVWWGTWTECAVAISRLKREGSWDEEYEEETRAALDSISMDWLEIEPTGELRLLAMLVSKTHSLKAADCLQLAAALRWCEGSTYGADFVCMDNRLRRAALDEGFDVLPESMEL